MVSVTLPVILYIWLPWFLMHSGLGVMLGMSSKLDAYLH